MSAIDRVPLITSVANPAVKAAAKLRARKGRRDQNRFLVEGPRAIADGAHLVTEVFVTEACAKTHDALVHQLIDAGAELRLVSDEVLREISDTVTPQGIIGVATIQSADLASVLAQDPKLVVVCDQVADPGNAGTIIRTADAAGADAVVLLAGSTDPFSPKAIRASVGSIFHLPVVVGAETADTIDRLQAAGLQCLAAEVHEGSDVFVHRPGARVALILGGEAAGLSDETKQRSDQLVRIPMPTPQRPGYTGHAESLNLAAAAAIMTFAVARSLAD